MLEDNKPIEDMPTLTEEEVNPHQDLINAFHNSVLDSDSTSATLGEAHTNVNSNMLLQSSMKLLGMSKGTVEADNRDSMEFQVLKGSHDLFSERVLKDPGNVARSILWKATNKGTLKNVIPTAIFDKHIKAVFNDSGLNQQLEGINPLEQHDLNTKVTRLGPGGIASMDSIPDESRYVQNSYLGYVDSVRSPESLKIGVDNFLAHGTKFSADGKLWQQLFNTRTKKLEWVPTTTASRSNVAFPESMTDNKSKRIATLHGQAGLRYVDRKEVDYIVPHATQMFSSMTNSAPMFSGIKGARALMAAKMGLQALPLRTKEVPHVVNRYADGKTATELFGEMSGAVKAKATGMVEKVGRDYISVRQKDGTLKEYETYHNFPHARKTYINSKALVKAGDVIKKGQLIAKSNYNDDNGEMANGVNLRVGYLAYKGYSHEDGVVVSESAAKKLASEHMYNHKFRKDDNTDVNKSKYISTFPSKYNKRLLDNFTDEGHIKTGTIVDYKDPLILAVKQQAPRPGTMGRKLSTDSSLTWDHHTRGVVTDVERTKDGYRVFVRTTAPAAVGDKVSGRYGDKGVISKIVPDKEMLLGEDGKPLDILRNPTGIISRTNSAQVGEAALGKITEKTGKRYTVDAFSPESIVKFAKAEQLKHGIKDTEMLTEAHTGRTIPDVFVGNAYVYKLQHMSESKQSARSTHGYTQDKQPGKDSKRIGGMETAALVSHGVSDVLQDIKLIKGQENDEYWRDLKMGRSPKAPKDIFVYNKFKDEIKAAGVNLYTDAQGGDNIFAMTAEDVNKLTRGHEVKTADTYNPKTMQAIPSGLFGDASTGGAEGGRFAYVALDEPVLNPIMEDPVKRILGLTGKQFDAIIAGDTEYNGMRGGNAMKGLLEDFNVNKEIRSTLVDISTATKSKRDAAVKKLRALYSFRDHKVKPSDFMLTKVPVLPPKYRPITIGDDMNMVADVNFLYKELIHSRDDLRDGLGVLPTSALKESRANVYNNFKAVVGLAAPTNKELEKKGVGGILKHVFGKGSPKHGQFQRRVLGGSQDVTGRGVITPNPNLKLNQVGIPINTAWTMYEPFLVRDMLKSGYGAKDAAKAIEDKTPRALEALQRVIKERPVLLNRAPTLHKYSINALDPVLVPGNMIQVSNFLLDPIGGDYDGDTMVAHIPVSDKAVADARKNMSIEANLRGARNHDILWKPSMDYILGASMATKEAKAEPAKVFKTQEDAVRAYKRGEIRIDTPVKIVTK